jgi:hypothetical protein
VNESTITHWSDSTGQVWREVTPTLLVLEVDRYGKTTDHVDADSRPRADVERLYGELTRVQSCDVCAQSNVPTAHTTPLGHRCPSVAGRYTLPADRERERERDQIAEAGWSPRADDELVDPTESDRQKIRNAAAALDDLAVMIKEVTHDLRGTDARPGGENGRRYAYARLYFLRRELGRVVATLGAEAPPNAVIKTLEARYRSHVRD